MKNSEKLPKAIGSPKRVFEITMEMLSEAGAQKILDCPTGEGPFAKMAMLKGLDVVAADVYPDQFAVPELQCVYVDMNDRLPYENESFDAVVCLNGLQRVWALGRAIQEIQRVLRPGGIAIISFPNNSDIRRRVMFGLTGSVTWNVIGPPEVFDPKADNPASCFRYAMTLPNVLNALESVGMDCTRIWASRFSKGAIVLSPLILGPVLFSIFSPRKYKNVYDKRLFRTRQNSTLTALLGEFLVVQGKKPNN